MPTTWTDGSLQSTARNAVLVPIIARTFGWIRLQICQEDKLRYLLASVINMCLVNKCVVSTVLFGKKHIFSSSPATWVKIPFWFRRIQILSLIMTELIYCKTKNIERCFNSLHIPVPVVQCAFFVLIGSASAGDDPGDGGRPAGRGHCAARERTLCLQAQSRHNRRRSRDYLLQVKTEVIFLLQRFETAFRFRFHLIRIRIQSGSRLLMTKIWK